MKSAAVLLLPFLLASCASAPPMPPAAGLFHDTLFAAPSVPIQPAEAMAVSPAMRKYLAEKILSGPRFIDRKQQLIDALYRKDELLLEYDAAVTRTATQAFDARSGNCLALVLMTSAFAREMGLSVRYQSVLGEDSWDRAGDIVVSVGHVNLTLSDRPPQNGLGLMDTGQLTIDFVAPRNARALRSRVIQEHTVIAMFLNNRAVESLVSGRTDDAYWWAREAIRRDPELLGAYVTLGVVYRTARQPALAESALARVNAREPDNTHALANRVLALRDLGRLAEAGALQHRLDRLDPHPRFADFELGKAAMRERRFEDARRLFEREVARAPDYHEFRFWLAVAQAELGDPQRAAEQLALAMRASTTRRDHDLYAAKLDRLKAFAAP